MEVDTKLRLSDFATLNHWPDFQEIGRRDESNSGLSRKAMEVDTTLRLSDFATHTHSPDCQEIDRRPGSNSGLSRKAMEVDNMLRLSDFTTLNHWPDCQEIDRRDGPDSGLSRKAMEVDTTLRLSDFATLNHQPDCQEIDKRDSPNLDRSRKAMEVDSMLRLSDFATLNHQPDCQEINIRDSPNLGRSRKAMEVDIMLRLSDFTSLSHPPELQEIDKRDGPITTLFAEEVDSSMFLQPGPDMQEEVLSPTPLRAFHPRYGCMHTFHRPPSEDSDVTTAMSEKKPPAKRKRNHQEIASRKKGETGRKKRKDPARRKVGYGEPYANLPTKLLEKTGPGWVFLFRKKLEASDVSKNLNRLFVTAEGAEKISEGFLTAEERRAVRDKAGPGIEFAGLDGEGSEYNLRMKTWGSLDVTVIKSGWKEMVGANKAKAGFWVDVWGYRSSGQKGFLMAVNFSAGGQEDGRGVERV